MSNNTPIEIGDRFEDKDPRNEGRIIKVIEKDANRYRIETEVHPTNPRAVGRTFTVHESTLRNRYRKVSH